jgi:hypothetical protein
MTEQKELSLYHQAVLIGKELEVGKTKTIPMPSNIKMFRQYLSVWGAKNQRKYSTKISNGKLLVQRIEWFSFAS